MPRLSYLKAAASLLLLFPMASCDDGTGAVARGDLGVEVSMAGEDRDPDGFLVSVDGGSARVISAGETLIFEELEHGSHVVLLEDMASNCSVSGENPRSVDVRAGRVVQITFEVQCASTKGNLQVNAPTAGLMADGDGYTVTVDDVWSQDVSANGSRVFSDLEAGLHSLELAGVAGNCALDGPNPRQASVSGGETTQVTFAVTCALELDHDVAFVSDRDGDADIFLLNAEGSGLRNLTRGLAAIEADPAWSPDGSKIAFTSHRDGDCEIYVIDADGGNPVNLTQHSACDSHPTWSPDGARIAFSSDRDGDDEVYVMNANGTDPVRLTDDPARDETPAWSPDGMKIAFASDRAVDGRDRGFGIFTVNTDGTGVVRLTRGLGEENMHPAWSPDALRIAFTYLWSSRVDIHVVRIDGTEYQRLTTDKFWNTRPSWSPDGMKIAFTTWRGRGYYDIYIINADGTGLTNLTNDPAKDDQAAWSPR